MSAICGAPALPDSCALDMQVKRRIWAANQVLYLPNFDQRAWGARIVAACPRTCKKLMISGGSYSRSRASRLLYSHRQWLEHRRSDVRWLYSPQIYRFGMCTMSSRWECVGMEWEIWWPNSAKLLNWEVIQPGLHFIVFNVLDVFTRVLLSYWINCTIPSCSLTFPKRIPYIELRSRSKAFELTAVAATPTKNTYMLRKVDN